MPKFCKIITSFLFVLILYFLSFQKSEAKDFQFDYVVNYHIVESGLTQVNHAITITNLVSDYYTQSFVFNISSAQITDINVKDNTGEIIPEVTHENGQTGIKIIFSDKVVGLNKQKVFNINYSSQDIALKKGNIWEVIIPGILQNSDINSYNVYVKAPETFGLVAYTYPPKNSQGFWSLNDLKQGGINIIYGNEQIYKYDLIYYLSNDSLSYQTQEITLPPDTAYQKVLLENISEKPINIKTDTDGNWIASYVLKPKEEKKIIARGNIWTHINPDNDFSNKLNDINIEDYSKSLKYWEQTPEIISKAKELKNIKNIYDWVVSYLTYDFETSLEGSVRNGAEYIFKNPQLARCMDFSDLFVSLARSVNLPAREIHGFAYTANSRLQPVSQDTDILHAWPEYYDFDKKLWIPVDPTWGNTTHGIDYFNKLDFNHVVLAILGKESDYPFPAGAFTSKTPTKNVNIEFAKDVLKYPHSEYNLSLNSNILYSGLDNQIKLQIINTGKVAVNVNRIIINSQIPIDYTSVNKLIPPLGNIDIPVALKPNFSLTSKMIPLEIVINENKQTINIIVKSSFLIGFPFTLIFLICCIILVLLNYEKHKSKKSGTRIP